MPNALLGESLTPFVAGLPLGGQIKTSPEDCAKKLKETLATGHLSSGFMRSKLKVALISVQLEK